MDTLPWSIAVTSSGAPRSVTVLARSKVSGA